MLSKIDFRVFQKLKISFSQISGASRNLQKINGVINALINQEISKLKKKFMSLFNSSSLLFTNLMALKPITRQLSVLRKPQ